LSYKEEAKRLLFLALRLERCKLDGTVACVTRRQTAARLTKTPLLGRLGRHPPGHQGTTIRLRKRHLFSGSRSKVPEKIFGCFIGVKGLGTAWSGADLLKG
jgi:hypothetical protein